MPPHPSALPPGSAPGHDAAAPAVVEHGTGDRLPRQLGFWSATALAVGLVVGSGIFRAPSAVAADAGTAGRIALVWTAGGLIALCGALALAELAVMFPRSGGLYAFLREAYGPPAAFAWGWTALVVLPASAAALAVVVAEYFGVFVPLTGVGTRLVAAALIVGVASVAYRSTRGMSALQSTATAAKVAALVGIVALAFALDDGAGGALAAPTAGAPPAAADSAAAADWGQLGVALVAALYAYHGWHSLTFVGGEVRDPARTYPRALLTGMAVVLAVYLAVNTAYLYVLPVSTLASSPLVAADVMRHLLGPRASAVVSALVMLSAFGTLVANVLTQPRVFYAMAEDGLFFRRLAAVHPRHRTPHVAVALVAAMAVALAALLSFDQLRELLVVGVWPFLALLVLGVPILRRRRPGVPRPYRTPGYPLVPLAFVAATLAVLVNIAVQHPRSTLASFAFTLLGVPVYVGWRRAGGVPAAPVVD